MLERLRHHKDVEYVCYSLFSRPYYGASSFYGMHKDSLHIHALEYMISPDFFNVFRWQNIDGSGSQSLADAILQQDALIVSSTLLDEKYPGLITDPKQLLGQTFVVANDTLHPKSVTAVYRNVRYDEFSKPISSSKAKLLPESELASYPNSILPNVAISVRVKDGTPSDFAQRLLDESDAYDVGQCFIQSVQPMEEAREDMLGSYFTALHNRAFIMVFLLINIFLGIVGTFWYRTQQRKSELGLRMAMGSSRRQLNRLIMGEGMLLLLSAAIPSVIVCWFIGESDITNAWQITWGISRFAIGLLITLGAMMLMIAIGIWYPVYKATHIEPAEALHNE